MEQYDFLCDRSQTPLNDIQTPLGRPPPAAECFPRRDGRPGRLRSKQPDIVTAPQIAFYHKNADAPTPPGTPP
jgi:hypothetical protein